MAQGVDLHRLVSHATSGSSGAPLNIWRTWFEERLLQAYRLRVAFGLGFRPTHLRAVVGWFPQEHRSDRHSLMKLGLFRTEEVHCLLPAEEMLSQLRRIQPDFLGGYAGTLWWLAGLPRDSDRARIRPRLITTGAETLTSQMRRQISEGFRAPVVDYYGSHEFNLIASECPGTGQYHIAEPMLIAEILRDGRPVQPGETGEPVGTALHSYAMPFIRYRLGDLVTRGEPQCPCEAPFATIARIEGRAMDRFPLPDGTSVHPYAVVDPLMSQASWLRRYQIVQDRTDHLTVKLAPRTEPPPDALPALERLITAAFGGQVRVALRLVDEIPPEPNGKFRPYYSLVGRDGERAAWALT
jgi:phenylacetate-CoA ligase